MGLPKREELVRIADVPKVVMRMTGIKRTKPAIYAWVRKGVRAYDNRLVKLRVERRLRMLFTTEKWIEDFIKAISWRD